MSIWQFIGYAAAATGVAIGVTALACEGIVRFLDWLYPDAPEHPPMRDDEYLAELARLARKAERDPMGAFGAGRVMSHSSRPTAD